MKSSERAKSYDNLSNKEKFSILDIIDDKVETEMKELTAEIRSLKETLNAKYNVLLGMITFLGIVITVVSIIVGLKS